jgi:hypothetical protein
MGTQVKETLIKVRKTGKVLEIVEVGEDARGDLMIGCENKAHTTIKGLTLLPSVCMKLTVGRGPVI